MTRFFKSGPGWRLGWNPTALSYKGLVGTDEWAIELTEAEFKDFCRLAQELQKAIAAIENELMEEEKITCEVESDLLWLEADGYPHSYSLRLILHQDRRCEGNWSPDAVLPLLEALETLTIF